METQKIINLITDSSSGESKSTTKVIDNQKEENKDNWKNSMKFETENIK